MGLYKKERGDASETTTNIIRVSALLVIGVVILNGIVGSMALAASVAASGTIEFDTNSLTNGGNFTIGSDIYEFDSGDGVNASAIDVDIGASLPATLTAIIAASVAHGTEPVIITSDGINTLTVTADTTGTSGNSILMTENDAEIVSISAALSGGVAGDPFYNTGQSVINNVESGYTLAALMVLALGAAAIMRYMGFL